MNAKVISLTKYKVNKLLKNRPNLSEKAIDRILEVIRKKDKAK